MNKETKVTIKDRFTEIEGILRDGGYDDLADFMLERIEKLNKKSPSKAGSKNDDVISERILALLENSEGMTATEIYNALDVSDLEDVVLSLPKITARLTYLGKTEKKIDRMTDKKRVYFVLGSGVGFKE